MKENDSTYPTKGLAFLHILGFILVLTLNTLAIVLPLNGKSTKQLSDEYPNLFTPAGLTFSIWSVIYLFLLGFTIYQAIILFKKAHPSRNRILSISKPFLVNCLANASWIFAWHHEQVLLSVFIMVVILGSLMVIHERLGLALPVRPLADKLWIDLPFSFYFGWISIATIANFTAVLVHFSWSGAGIDPTFWTAMMIAIGTALNIYMILVKKNIAFGLVGIWAFVGIILKRQLVDEENTNHVIFVSQICISLIAAVIILQILKYWKQSLGAEIRVEKVAES